MKDASDGQKYKDNFSAEERICEFEDVSTETSKTERQKEKNTKNI